MKKSYIIRACNLRGCVKKEKVMIPLFENGCTHASHFGNNNLFEAYNVYDAYGVAQRNYFHVCINIVFNIYEYRVLKHA